MELWPASGHCVLLGAMAFSLRKLVAAIRRDDITVDRLQNDAAFLAFFSTTCEPVIIAKELIQTHQDTTVAFSALKCASDLPSLLAKIEDCCSAVTNHVIVACNRVTGRLHCADSTVWLTTVALLL